MINLVQSFLIFPPNLTFREIDDYIQSRKSGAPIRLDEILIMIGNANQIPFLKVVRHLNMLRCYLIL